MSDRPGTLSWLAAACRRRVARPRSAGHGLFDAPMPQIHLDATLFAPAWIQRGVA
jgi:hypothetical protein